MNEDELDLETHQAALLITALQSQQVIRFVASGTSMSPVIPSGSLVTISPCNPYHLKCGEVALCVLDSTTCSKAVWVLHRVIYNDRSQQRLKLAGDRLPVSDDLRSYDQIMGVLTAIDVDHSPRIKLFLKPMHHDPRSLYARVAGLSSLGLYRLYSRMKLMVRFFVK